MVDGETPTSVFFVLASVAELADAPDLGSDAARHMSSTLITRIKIALLVKLVDTVDSKSSAERRLGSSPRVGIHENRHCYNSARTSLLRP